MHIPYYTGTKGLLKPKIVPRVLHLTEGVAQYREPFIGSGAIGLAVMSRRPNFGYWLNDRDPAVSCMWWSIQDHNEQLIRLIEAFTPSVDEFNRLKDRLARVIRVVETDAELTEIGFAKLAIQHMCFNGFGAGMRGGKAQRLDRVGERWKPALIARNIQLIHQRLHRMRARITGYDFMRLIEDASEPAIIYCDPPYLGASNNYLYDFTPEDHRRLADVLGTTKHKWCLSYGDHPDIRRLYSWARIEEIGFHNLLIYRA